MQKRNVIVVMLDSLQHNYLGCYGNKWIKTPNLDRLAREGVVFENNYIEGLPTVPCRRSMHTGRYAVHYRGWSPLELEETTIADLCWGRPIDTALIFDCPMYRQPKYGYTRGFDKVWFLHGHEQDHEFYHTDPLIHRDPRDFMEDHVIEAVGKKAGEDYLDEIADYLRQRQYWKTDEDQNVSKVMKKAVQYLENIDRNKSFYLWVDSFDPHEPWDPPSVYDPDMKNPYDPDFKGKDQFLPILGPAKAYTEAELNHIRMLYAEKVTMCDKWVGYLLDNIRKLGLEDNTLFLLVSDHGEPLGHGADGHGIMRKCMTWPYEELVHAPMLMKGPGIPAGKRIKGFTQSCDVAPTVTDFLGIGVHPSHTGKSLLKLAKGEVDKVRDFAISGWFNRSWSIYTEDFSYIHWKQPGDKDVSGGAFYVAGMLPYYALLGRMPSGTTSAAASDAGMKAETGGAAHGAREMKMWNAARAVQEEIWTSTVAADNEPPRTDELYDRKSDQFQLKDIAAKNPKKAAELYKTLADFMNELRKT